ncbi:MAG: N-6 DNA methylase, partial [Anaerolineae bacterium]
MNAFIDNVIGLLTDFREKGSDYLTYINKKVTHGDEAVVRQKLVEPLIVALGYDLAKEVQPEERAGSGSADIYARAIGPDPANPAETLTVPACVWELKRTGIHELEEHEEQLQTYVLTKHVRYGVLTNGHEIRLYERVGERIELSFTVNLTAFAPGSTAPATEDEKMALTGMYDVLHRDSFLDVERFKHTIVTPPYHSLRLSPDFVHNEDGLINQLKQEIRHLKRLVVLNFRTHQRLAAEFEKEEQERRSQIDQTKTAVLQAITLLQEKLKLEPDTSALNSYLEKLAEKWTLVEEDDFVKRALAASAVEPHLQGADRATFTNRARRYFQQVTNSRRWETQQTQKLAISNTLMRNFQHWQEEIGIMAADPAIEFCLQTVYIFITRLLLIRICEDKGIITEKISDGGYKTYLEFSDKFYDYFGHANRRLLEMAYDDTSYIYGHFFSKSVFDWYNWEEETIVRLLAVLNPYNFKEVSADLIGRIYEEYVDELERKRKGQFYTPANVVGKVLDAAGYEGPPIINKRLLDPACGSGRFLVEAMRRLIAQWEQAYRQSNMAVDYQELINDRLRHSLYGLDVNRFACFLAEVNLVVQVLDLFKKSNDQFTILRFHIYPTNSLLPEEGNGNGGRIHLTAAAANDLEGQERFVAELIKQRWHHPTNERLDFRGGFDFIVGNPPYVRADNPGVT